MKTEIIKASHGITYEIIRLYRDIETDELLTKKDLVKEYETLSASGDTEAKSADEYINNCLTRNNGTLEVVVFEKSYTI